jgi:hypothetical protein
MWAISGGSLQINVAFSSSRSPCIVFGDCSTGISRRPDGKGQKSRLRVPLVGMLVSKAWECGSRGSIALAEQHNHDASRKPKVASNLGHPAVAK